jgi:hypothetical protein
MRLNTKPDFVAVTPEAMLTVFCAEHTVEHAQLSAISVATAQKFRWSG